MNQQFYYQFNPNKKNIIAIVGDQLRTSLINVLAYQAIKMKYHVFIIADTPKSYPLGGKVLVCDTLSIVTQLIDKDKPERIYLASKIKNDFLHPFIKKEIKKFVGSLGEKNVLLLDIDKRSKIDIKSTPFLKNAQMVCSINYNLLKDNLPRILNTKELKSKSIDDQMFDKVYSIIKNICPHFLELDEVKNKICFIDQVKGLYDENVIRSIARNLKSKMNCTMLIGNSNSYRVKAI